MYTIFLYEKKFLSVSKHVSTFGSDCIPRIGETISCNNKRFLVKAIGYCVSEKIGTNPVLSKGVVVSAKRLSCY